MKKNLIFVFLLYMFGSANAQITIPKDIPLHFGAGFVIGSVGGYTSHHLFNGNPYWFWAGAIGSSLAAGVTKESMDKADYGGWDNKDILYTTLGGIASGVVLDLFLKKSRKRKRFRPCDCYAIKLELPIQENITYLDISNTKSGNIMANIQAQRILEMP